MATPLVTEAIALLFDEFHRAPPVKPGTATNGWGHYEKTVTVTVPNKPQPKNQRYQDRYPRKTPLYRPLSYGEHFLPNRRRIRERANQRSNPR